MESCCLEFSNSVSKSRHAFKRVVMPCKCITQIKLELILDNVINNINDINDINNINDINVLSIGKLRIILLFDAKVVRLFLFGINSIV